MNIQEKFEAWCIVELFGHAKIAGLCTEQNIAGTNFLRVDVPETETQPAFTRLFGAAAIYAINPVDQKTAIFMAGKLQEKPIEAWDLTAVMQKFSEKLSLTHAEKDDDAIEEEDEEMF
jgi:hypothetical protein